MELLLLQSISIILWNERDKDHHQVKGNTLADSS